MAETATSTSQNHSAPADDGICNSPVKDAHAGNLPSASTQPQPQQGYPVSSTPLRRGKWTAEEEAYAVAAILDFNSGYLDAAPGITLRSYLSERLGCDPMRITKKFTGDASIGKKVFHPAVRDDPKIIKDIEDSQAKLDNLFQRWKQRLESQEQEMARKSMAAAAVSVATSLCDNPNHPFFAASSPSHLLHGVGHNMRVPQGISSIEDASIQCAQTRSDITKTATWLDQAESLLTKSVGGSNKEMKEEMKVIAKLIEEAPTILAISAELPKLLGHKQTIESGTRLEAPHRLHSCPDLRILSTKCDTEQSAEESVSTPTTGKRKRSLSGDDTCLTDSPNNPMKILASLSSQAAPVPIVDSGNQASAESDVSSPKADPEDAKTFVNFLVHVNK